VGSGVGGRKHTQDGSREEGGEESLLLPWSLTPLSNMHTLTQSQTSKAKAVLAFIFLPFLHRPHDSGPIQWARGGVGLKSCAAARPHGFLVQVLRQLEGPGSILNSTFSVLIQQSKTELQSCQHVTAYGPLGLS